jgi:integrase
MRVDELDLENAAWKIPGTRTKNGVSHTVPLSGLAAELIKEALATAGEGAKAVFPAGDGSLAAQAVARTILRAQEGEGRFGIAHWTSHDLRRSAVSYMAELGVVPIVLGHIINHVSTTKAGVTLSVYQQYDYGKEKRAALDLWASRISAIVAGQEARIISLGRRV